MKYWKLFLEFFKIGLFTFGGGLSMIPLIQKTVVEKNKWITDEEMVDMIAISESTPGPIAVNCATFIGYKVGKIWGGILATLGVVLPSFIIIIIVCKIISKFLNNKYVNYAMKGARPVVCGLIFAVAISLIYACFLPNGFSIKAISDISFASIIIFIISFVLLRFKKTEKPILVILISGVLGIIFFGLIGGF